MSRVPQLQRPPNSLARPGKKPSTTCARTGTEAYHHMAIPSHEPTSAMMTEPGVIEENFSSCREACAATGPWSIVSDRSGLDELPVNCWLATELSPQLPASWLPKHPNTNKSSTHLRPPHRPTWRSAGFRRTRSRPDFRLGIEARHARYLHFWGSGRYSRNRCILQFIRTISLLPRKVCCVSGRLPWQVQVGVSCREQGIFVSNADHAIIKITFSS
jgi:hypothetical protein